MDTKNYVVCNASTGKTPTSEEFASVGSPKLTWRKVSWSCVNSAAVEDAAVQTDIF